MVQFNLTPIRIMCQYIIINIYIIVITVIVLLNFENRNKNTPITECEIMRLVRKMVLNPLLAGQSLLPDLQLF
jgi:hypothetical protein